jgi:arylsulfatase A-like enzyme
MKKYYNVITLFVDTFREECLYNDKVKMPNLKKFISEKCTNFTQIVPESLPTVQVRKSMFTCDRFFPYSQDESVKKDYDNFREANNNTYGWCDISDTRCTVAEMFKGLGYDTAFVSNTNPFVGFNLNNLRTKGFETVKNYKNNSSIFFDYIITDELKSSYFNDEYTYSENSFNIYNDNPWYLDKNSKLEDTVEYNLIMSALSELKYKRPMIPKYLHIDYFSLHQPYVVLQKYLDMYEEVPYEGTKIFNPMSGFTYEHEYPNVPYEYPVEAVENLKNRYYAQCTMFDDLFGIFLDELEKANLIDNTIIMIYSDHGICLGEYNMFAKESSCLIPNVLKNMCAIYVPGWYPETNDKLFYNYECMSTLVNHIFGCIEMPVRQDTSNVILDRGRDFVCGCFFKHLFYYDKNYLYTTTKDRLYQYLWDVKAEKFISVELNERLTDEFYYKIMEDGGYEFPDPPKV